MDLTGYPLYKSKNTEILGQKALLDSDVADLYGVQSKYVNQAVKNNLRQSPVDYLIELTLEKKQELVKNFDWFSFFDLEPTESETTLKVDSTVGKLKYSVVNQKKTQNEP